MGWTSVSASYVQIRTCIRLSPGWRGLTFSELLCGGSQVAGDPWLGEVAVNTTLGSWSAWTVSSMCTSPLCHVWGWATKVFSVITWCDNIFWFTVHLMLQKAFCVFLCFFLIKLCCVFPCVGYQTNVFVFECSLTLFMTSVVPPPITSHSRCFPLFLLQSLRREFHSVESSVCVLRGNVLFICLSSVFAIQWGLNVKPILYLIKEFVLQETPF